MKTFGVSGHLDSSVDKAKGDYRSQFSAPHPTSHLLLLGQCGGSQIATCALPNPAVLIKSGKEKHHTSPRGRPARPVGQGERQGWAGAALAYGVV